jgi:hypothetical protein
MQKYFFVSGLGMGISSEKGYKNDNAHAHALDRFVAG